MFAALRDNSRSVGGLPLAWRVASLQRRTDATRSDSWGNPLTLNETRLTPSKVAAAIAPIALRATMERQQGVSSAMAVCSTRGPGFRNVAQENELRDS